MITVEATEQAARSLTDPPAKNPLGQDRMQITERSYAEFNGVRKLTYEKIGQWEVF